MALNKHNASCNKFDYSYCWTHEWRASERHLKCRKWRNASLATVFLFSPLSSWRRSQKVKTQHGAVRWDRMGIQAVPDIGKRTSAKALPLRLRRLWLSPLGREKNGARQNDGDEWQVGNLRVAK